VHRLKKGGKQKGFFHQRTANRNSPTVHATKQRVMEAGSDVGKEVLSTNLLDTMQRDGEKKKKLGHVPVT